MFPDQATNSNKVRVVDTVEGDDGRSGLKQSRQCLLTTVGPPELGEVDACSRSGGLPGEMPCYIAFVQWGYRMARHHRVAVEPVDAAVVLLVEPVRVAGSEAHAMRVVAEFGRGIGQELARAGHDVVWCGPENVLRPLVGPDATVHATGTRSYRRYEETGMAGVRAMWDGYLIPFTRFTLGPVDEAVLEHKPDVVVTEQYALAGALVAHRHGVPWATLCTGTLELTPPADLVGDMPSAQDVLNQKTRDFH